MPTFWLFSFFKEAYGELKKATWLSRKEMVQSTVVVIVLVLIMAAYIAVVDFILSITLGAVLGGR